MEESKSLTMEKMKRTLQILLKLALYVLAVPIVLMIRLIRPWLLIRFDGLISERIGHFAANTEMYLCERDAGINVPRQRHVDIWYMGGAICNQQLAMMWRRKLRVWPGWVLAKINRLNKMVPFGAIHEIGDNTQGDRDVLNLLDRIPPHLEFTEEEERNGRLGLNKMGIANNASYICFHARNPYYLPQTFPNLDWSHSDFVNADIRNFIPAALALCRRGNFAIRIGAKVNEPIEIDHPMVIDYAWDHRSDFLDIYLGSKCKFFLISPTGIATIAAVFRRPIACVNMVPLEFVTSWGENNLSIFKKHWLRSERRFMTFHEIFESGASLFMHSQRFEDLGIELIDNTPEEILALALEMDDHLAGKWEATEEDEELQKRFWDIFPTSAVHPDNGRPLHGEIRSRIGAEYLRQNKDLLD